MSAESITRAAAGNRPAPVLGALLGATGIAIFVSAFFIWVLGLTGWNLMFGKHFGPESNMFFAYAGGLLVFSGFWALVLGLLIMAAAVLAFTGSRISGILAVTVSVIGLILSVGSIATAYDRGLNAGVGLFLFAAFSLIALVLGITSILQQRQYRRRGDSSVPQAAWR